MTLTIAIIVYNRYENIKKWLECWQLCEQHGVTLNIIHTGDEREKFKAICDQYGANYIPRENIGRDIGATQDVFLERLEGFNNDWDWLLWITDDVIPMSRDFITPFLDAMKPGVGVAALQISQAIATHVRTVCYCITKEASRKIKFPADPVLTQLHGYFWEHRGGGGTLTRQIWSMGLKTVQVAPDQIAPLWDTGYGKRLERMHEHYKIFPMSKKENVIHHFYHIYADGQWQEPVQEHIRALKMGLLNELTTFNIGIVGSPQNRRIVKQYLVEQGCYFNIIAQANTGWEQVTQVPMHEFSKHNDGLILYAHTKGGHDPSPVNIRWRRSMIWCNVINWKECVKQLQTHDMVGCHWIHPVLQPENVFGNWIFAGTFFWGHASLIRTFPPVKMHTRHEAEVWCGYKYAEKPFSVYDFTPYWPNTNTFADGWLDDPENYIPELIPKSNPA